MRRSALVLFGLATSSFLAWGAARAAFASAGDGFGIDALHLAVKAVLWLLPAAIYARRALGEGVAEAFALRAPARAGVGRALLLGVLYLSLVSGLGFALGQSPTMTLLPVPTLALEGANAAVEEAAFRGFLLLHLARGRRFWLANLLAGLFFVGVHVPTFLRSGAGLAVLPMCAGLLVLALVLGYATRVTRSIVIPSLIHLANNLMAG